ncbi:MAG: glycosyltransferase [Patescibacteria group bacterium]
MKNNTPKSLTILHVSKWERWPGGAIAVNRLHEALIQNHANSKVLVENRVSSYDPSIVQVTPPKVSYTKQAYAWLRNLRDQGSLASPNDSTVSLFSPNLRPNYIARHINNTDCDLVHVHFARDNFLPIYEVSRIKKPIVWTLHNCWPFTGGCQIQWNCKRYQKDCGKCPLLKSSDEKDLSYKVLGSKKRYWSDLNMTLIAPSRWIYDAAKRSSLFCNKRIELIPNGLDTSLFRPIDKKTARSVLGLPKNKAIILFGAENSTGQPHKGFSHLVQALNSKRLKPKSKQTELVVFGSSDPKEKRLFQFRQHYLGTIREQRFMALLYNAADVFVAPYLVDNLPSTVIESISCGTPVASFNSGGLNDIIDHKKNGFLAKPHDSDDLAEGIDWILDHIASNHLSKNAREKAIEVFDQNIVAQKHISLYQDIIGNTKR